MKPDGDLAERVLQLEQELEALRIKLAVHESQESRPSFHRLLVLLRQMNAEMPSADPDRLHPAWNLGNKLRMYDFAASHGVRTPEVFRQWESLEQIDLKELPDEFVLKSTGGSSGHGVVPLRRRGNSGAYEVVGEEGQVSAGHVLMRLAKARDKRRTYGVYFAEELLTTSEAPRIIPDDVKIYSFYGRPFQVLIRRVSSVRDQDSVLNRYLSPRGDDLGAITDAREISRSVAIPKELDDLVETAAHLSHAVGLPFCRVDLYSHRGEVKLGEITRAPGGPQQYSHAHDEAMGRAWLDAQLRLDVDLQNGRPPGVLFGSRKVVLLDRSPAWADQYRASHRDCPECGPL